MRKILIVLSLLFSFFVELSAMEVVPFIHSISPEENENSFQYYITNKTDELIAFEVSAFRRKQDKHGGDILEKDEDSFHLFPSQIIIPPHTQRIVKVKWVGNKDFEENKNKEQAFRVCFDQFRISTKKKLPRKHKGASIDVTLRIFTSLYVTPKNAQGKVELVSNNGSLVVVKNVGSKRVSVADMLVKIHNKDLRDLLGEKGKHGVILSGDTREFSIRPAM